MCPTWRQANKKRVKHLFKYFNKEIEYLENLKIIVALGKIAFDACIEFYKKHHKIDQILNLGIVIQTPK